MLGAATGFVRRPVGPGTLLPVSRTSTLLASLTGEPATTSEVYDRVGYVTLTRLGLVPYPAFRAELARMSAAGLVVSNTDRDGATTWSLPSGPAHGDGNPAVPDLTSEA
jgi:hypothetical protein